MTDSTANMRAAWDILEAEYPHIFCNGCAAHVFNLLVKDICDTDACQSCVGYMYALLAYEEVPCMQA